MLPINPKKVGIIDLATAKQKGEERQKDFLLREMGIKNESQFPSKLSKFSTLTDILMYGTENKLFKNGTDITLEKPVLSIPMGKHLVLSDDFWVVDGKVLSGAVTFHHGKISAAGPNAVVYAKGNAEAVATVPHAQVYAMEELAHVYSTVLDAETFPFNEATASKEEIKAVLSEQNSYSSFVEMENGSSPVALRRVIDREPNPRNIGSPGFRIDLSSPSSSESSSSIFGSGAESDLEMSGDEYFTNGKKLEITHKNTQSSDSGEDVFSESGPESETDAKSIKLKNT
jgi:hypothetical protein